MNDFSIFMALVDFLPVIFWGMASIVLQRGLYPKMMKGSFALFAAGTINVFAAGLLKAVWKLLYAGGVCDFTALNALFFPLQSIGFLLAGAGIIAMLLQKRAAALAVAPPLFRGTFLFVGLMVAGLGCMCGGLCHIALKMGRRKAVACFALSFACSLCMGYLSSRDVTSAAMNWCAELVNILDQGMLLWGAVILEKAGLKQFKL